MKLEPITRGQCLYLHEDGLARMLAMGLCVCVCVCLSVCLSVTRPYCIETAALIKIMFGIRAFLNLSYTVFQWTLWSL